MLTCRTLRHAVITSGLLLVLGWLFELVAVQITSSVYLSYLGLAVVFTAVSILALTFFFALMPVNARRLSHCAH